MSTLNRGLDEAHSDYDVTFHLLPLPLSVSNAYAPVCNRDLQTGREDCGFKGFNSNRKGKGKSKSNQQGSSPAPRGIKGAVGRDNRGRTLCFNYNLSECPDAPIGGTCRKGRHVCFKANCLKAHPFCTAHKDEMPKAVQGQD